MSIHFPCLQTDLSDWSQPLSQEDHPSHDEEEYIEDVLIESLKQFLLNPISSKDDSSIFNPRKSSPGVVFPHSEKELDTNLWLQDRPRLSSKQAKRPKLDNLDRFISTTVTKTNLADGSANDNIMAPVLKDTPQSYWLAPRDANLSTTLWLASSSTGSLTCCHNQKPSSKLSSSSSGSNIFKTTPDQTIEWPKIFLAENPQTWLNSASESQCQEAQDNWLDWLDSQTNKSLVQKAQEDLQCWLDHTNEQALLQSQSKLTVMADDEPSFGLWLSTASSAKEDDQQSCCHDKSMWLSTDSSLSNDNNESMQLDSSRSSWLSASSGSQVVDKPAESGMDKWLEVPMDNQAIDIDADEEEGSSIMVLAEDTFELVSSEQQLEEEEEESEDLGFWLVE